MAGIFARLRCGHWAALAVPSEQAEARLPVRYRQDGALQQYTRLSSYWSRQNIHRRRCHVQLLSVTTTSSLHISRSFDTMQQLALPDGRTAKAVDL